MSAFSLTYENRQKVLGYPVDIVSEESAVAIIDTAWKQARSLHVVTLNAEMIVSAQKDQALDRIIRHAHLIVPDGSGVVFALRLAGQPASKLAGIELAQAALREASKSKRRVALLGGKPAVVERLQQILIEQNPGLNIVAAHNGFWLPGDEEAIVKELAMAEPDLLLVAMGVPRQEYFLERWQSSFPRAVMIGVGGSFDVWVGSVKRAPIFFRRFHLEWLFRLIAEPWRYKRMASTLPNFAVQILTEAARRRIDLKNERGEHRGRKHVNKRVRSKEQSKEK